MTDKYQTYADILIEAAESKGISYDSLLDRQLARLSELRENRNLTAEELQELAYDETIAEMSETILSDTDAAQRVSQELYKQDRTLWEKIKDFFTGLVEKLRSAYKGVDPDSDMGRVMKRAIQDNETVAQAWAEAVVEAGENYQLQDGQKNNARAGERYSLRGYTDQQKKNWESSKRIVIYDNQEQLSQFISDSIANKTMDKKMYFGVIPADLAARIKSDTGVNVENFNLSLGSYEVRKILKDHGNAEKEAARGQRAIVADDFGHITDVVLNPAEITLSNQDYMGKPAIIFSGDYNGRMNVVAVVSDKRLDLFVQTVYTNVKKGNLATPTGEQAPINTPEANGSTVSDNSIRNSSEEVKGILKSSRDSEGNVLTEAQEKYFEDSQVRDDDGNLIPVYHKTSNEVTVFKRGKLGENTLYNANDASLAATSLVGHWFSDSENTPFMGDAIKSYLNITNPYYTSLDELAADIGDYASNLEVMQEHFENGQFNMVRNAARGYVNWMRWRGYDGLIVNDSETGGTSYVILDSRQAKLTTNESPTGVRDIRYSSRQRADGKAEQLATEVEYLKKLVQIQKKGNSDYTLDRTSLRQFASQLIRENGASGSSTELAALLEDTYNYISRSTDFLWEGIEERAGKAVDWLEAHRKVQRDSYAQEVLDFMSKRHVKLSEAQLGEVQYQYGSLKEFRSAIRGSIVLDQNANTTLDQFWQEGAAQFGDKFSADITDTDMPGALAELVQSLKESRSTESMEVMMGIYAKTTEATSFVENSFIMYADKRRTTLLLRSIGFHMPIELLQSGYTGNISYNR